MIHCNWGNDSLNYVIVDAQQVLVINLFFRHFQLIGIAWIAAGAAVLLRYEPILDVLKESQVNIVPIVAIVIGSIMLLISFFGCCGAIRESHCMVSTVSKQAHECFFITFPKFLLILRTRNMLYANSCVCFCLCFRSKSISSVDLEICGKVKNRMFRKNIFPFSYICFHSTQRSSSFCLSRKLYSAFCCSPIVRVLVVSATAFYITCGKTVTTIQKYGTVFNKL